MCIAEICLGAVVAIGAHLGSYHEAPGFNNVNPGLYARTSEGYLLGGYVNSFKRPLVYAAKDLPVYGPFSVAVGGATGYRWIVTPLVVPTARLGAGFNLSALTKVRGVNDGYVLHLTYERAIK